MTLNIEFVELLIQVSNFFQLLVALVSSYRYGGDEVDLRLAKAEAKILHEKISDKAYSDNEVIRILATRSKAQINATLNHYKDEYEEDILKVNTFHPLLLCFM